MSNSINHSFRMSSLGEGIYLLFPDGRDFVSTSQIVALQSERNYTWIHFRKKQPLLYSRNLGDLLGMLPTKSFLRIHHGHAVNIGFINSIMENQIILSDGSSWAISRRKAKETREQLKMSSLSLPTK